jgi:hypothetical protein
MKNVAKISRIGLAAAAAFAVATGCGGAAQQNDTRLSRLAAERAADLDSENGLWALALDGVDVAYTGEMVNGMPPNLLDVNGFSPFGVSTDGFLGWFASDPQTADMIMKYLTRCSLPAGSSLQFEYNGVQYSWDGLLGLAPVWAQDYPIPEIEQQLVTACLAAHANKYGAHVPISVLGRTSTGDTIPLADNELSDYPITEGCFFGNLFQGQGAFSANDRVQPLDETQSSSRACAMADPTNPGAPSNCPPIQFAGNCRDICQPSADGTFYESCQVNGVVYRPLTTRNKTTSLYTCGDGICDFTEHCGTGSTPDSCYLDCGACQ